LVLIGESEVLPALFEKVIIPSVVRAVYSPGELDRAQILAAVRNWIQSPPQDKEPPWRWQPRSGQTFCSCMNVRA